MAGGVFEVDLVGTNAEATDNEEVLGLAKNALGELSLGADADDVDIAGGKELAGVTREVPISNSTGEGHNDDEGHCFGNEGHQITKKKN